MNRFKSTIAANLGIASVILEPRLNWPLDPFLQVKAVQNFSYP